MGLPNKRPTGDDGLLVPSKRRHSRKTDPSYIYFFLSGISFDENVGVKERFDEKTRFIRSCPRGLICGLC